MRRNDGRRCVFLLRLLLQMAVQQRNGAECIGFFLGQSIGKFIPCDAGMSLDVGYDDIVGRCELHGLMIELLDRGCGTSDHHAAAQHVHDTITITVKIHLVVIGIERTERKAGGTPFGFERTLDESSSAEKGKRPSPIEKDGSESPVMIIEAAPVDVASDDLRQAEHHGFHRDPG